MGDQAAALRMLQDDADETLLRASDSGNLKKATRAIAEGANVNKKSELNHGFAPLHAASQHDHVEVVDLLLASGADASATSLEENRSPLHYASAHGSLRVVQSLVRHGVNVNEPCGAPDYAFTPIMCAAMHGHVAVIHALAAAGAVVDHVNFQGATAIAASVQNGQVEAVRALVQLGVDVNRVVPLLEANETYLMMAARLQGPEMVSALLEGGALPNLIRPNGLTALHMAVYAQNPENVRLLLAAGADANAVGLEDDTPLDIARVLGNSAIVAMLVPLSNNTRRRGKQGGRPRRGGSK